MYGYPRSLHVLTLPFPTRRSSERRRVDAKAFDDGLKAQPQRVAAEVASQRFAGKGYELAILPGDKDADDWSVVLGISNVGELSPWCLAKAAERLPEGAYRLAEGSSGAAALG